MVVSTNLHSSEKTIGELRCNRRAERSVQIDYYAIGMMETSTNITKQNSVLTLPAL